MLSTENGFRETSHCAATIKLILEIDFGCSIYVSCAKHKSVAVFRGHSIYFWNLNIVSFHFPCIFG